MEYILGVDGGNTKTDYFLFEVTGKFTDRYRSGTCSHEMFKDSFDSTYRIMNRDITLLFKRNNITAKDIKAAVFGLAGHDLPYQHERLCEIIRRMGFENFKVVNDSALAVKVGTRSGYGVCSVNGTGTSVTGIDKDGNSIQIGGVGSITGDKAGGKFISRKVVEKAYSEIMRFGEKTSLTPIVLDLIGNKSEETLMEDIALKFCNGMVDYNTLTVACFEEANKGDKVAKEILIAMADNLARSAAGAVVRLDLGETPEVVLAGSVYVKGACPVLVEEVKRRIDLYANKKCDTTVLKIPPALGAIVWGFELAYQEKLTYDERKRLIVACEKALAE